MWDHVKDGLTFLKNWLTGQQTARVRESQAYDEALESVMKAAIETRVYLRHLREGNPENTEKEGVLSQLWWQASVKLRHIDSALADRALIKADCWADPRLWDDERYKDIPLDLDLIIDQCRWLLRDRD